MGKYSVNKFRGVCDRLLDDGMDDTTKAYLDSIDNLELFHSSKITLESLEQLSEVKKGLDAILLKSCDFQEDKSMLISDKVSVFLDNCNDMVLASWVKDLYQEFIRLRNIICENNLDVVIQIAKKYVGLNGIDINEVIGWGNIGLITAIEKFDINCGTNFRFLAYRAVFAAINKNIYKSLFKLSLNSNIASDCYEFFGAIDEMYGFLGREPSDNELAQYLGFSIDRIKVLRELIDLNKSCFSVDLIPSSIDSLDSAIIHEEMKDAVGGLFDYLKEGQTLLIQYRYGFYDGKEYTLEEIGKMYGVMRQAIFNRGQWAMKKLRKHSTGLKVYLED